MVVRLRAAAVALLTVGVVVFGVAPAAGVAGFGDVAAGRYFTDAVQWMVDEDITTGTSANCFSPEDTVTRGQAAAFLWRMEGEPGASPHPFDDVVAPWQQGPVSWMHANGITTGTSATTYSPDEGLTRGQLAALLHRLAGEPAAPPHPFDDVTAPWQQGPVSWMFHLGITTGTGPATFSPDDAVTRGQAATFLYRYQGQPAVEVDATHPTNPPCPDQVAGPNRGFDSLFIGHSFFIPVAGELPALAADAGLADHTQDAVFSGGASGAPRAMWENASVRAGIQAALDDGDIELFGMTYHPTYPSLEGYRLWIDYAISQNPDTIIMIGLPWSTSPGSMDASTYASTWHDAHENAFHPLIDTLRAEFPDVVIFEIGYGHAATELYELFDAGQLPGIDSLVRSSGPGVFSDSFGHADQILRELAAHVWLASIYDVPLSTLDDPGFGVDLRVIAQEIVDEHDPTYNLP